MIQSEVIVRYKDVYAGTVDILCGAPAINADVVFDPSEHAYTHDGKVLPAVTRLISSGDEYANIPRFILDRAAEKGTAVHKEIEDYIKTGSDGFSHEFFEFKRIYGENKDVFNGQCVIDVKTWSAAKPELKEKACVQLNLYAKAVEYLTGCHIKDKYILWLPKAPKKGKLIKLEEKENDKLCNLDW